MCAKHALTDTVDACFDYVKIIIPIPTKISALALAKSTTNNYMVFLLFIRSTRSIQLYLEYVLLFYRSLRFTLFGQTRTNTKNACVKFNGTFWWWGDSMKFEFRKQHNSMQTNFDKLSSHRIHVTNALGSFNRTPKKNSKRTNKSQLRVSVCAWTQTQERLNTVLGRVFYLLLFWFVRTLIESASDWLKYTSAFAYTSAHRHSHTPIRTHLSIE